MSKKNDDAASRPDEDNPEWTREEIRTARPAIEAIGEIFGAQSAEAIHRRGGRSPSAELRQPMPRQGK